jgi:hypothetical protein
MWFITTVVGLSLREHADCIFPSKVAKLTDGTRCSTYYFYGSSRTATFGAIRNRISA